MTSRNLTGLPSNPYWIPLPKQTELFPLSFLFAQTVHIIVPNSAGNPAQGGILTADNKAPASTPVSLSSRDYFKALITDNPANRKIEYFSNPNISKSTGAKQIVIATNILGKGDVNAGLLAITIAGADLEKVLIESLNKIGEFFGTDATVIITSNTGSVISMIAYDPKEGKYTEQFLNQPTRIRP